MKRAGIDRVVKETRRTADQVAPAASSKALASTVRAKSQEQVGTFFWAEGCAPGSKVAFRRATDGAPRSVDEVCMEELVTLATNVMAAGKRNDSAMAAIARELGVTRAGDVVRGRIEQALRLASGS